MMKDYLTAYLNAIGSTQDLEICARIEVSKGSKVGFDTFDTSQEAGIPENVLLFRARIDREPDWLREHSDEIEERAAIMEFDGGLLREKAEGAAMDWARYWFMPLPF
ncbi:MAG: hypothetical protein LC778_14565 [Acidobacteria bacterium]|nr:hypothetical protein [Acidobacteriota bacterium]